MNALSKDEYSKIIKQREIKLYILENGENFDFENLAIHMEMTYAQLRKEIRLLLEEKKLVVRNGIIKVPIIDEYIFIKKEVNLQKKDHKYVIKNNQIYLPKNFQIKFGGYN